MSLRPSTYHSTVTSLMTYIFANAVANSPSSFSMTPEQHMTQFPAPFFETLSHGLPVSFSGFFFVTDF